MLRDWQTYYFLMGTASAGLIGLLFVALSIAVSIVTPNTDGIHNWTTPVIVHFSGVFFISALLIVPTLTPASLGSLLALIAVGFLVYLALIAVRLWRQRADFPLNVGDWLGNIVIPMASHLLILGTGLAFLANTNPTLNGFAIAVAALIAAGIRNAWDLTVWIAIQRNLNQSGG
jgi:hypothetical protein